MNEQHARLCASEGWAAQLGEQLVPWALAGATPPELLEVGAGPGGATNLLRRDAARLTALEYDPVFVDALRDRFAADPVVSLVHGDATALPFAAASFDGVASFTMLHHLPSAAAQDRAFAEFARVLRPGGRLLGTDSLDSPGLRTLHTGDVLVPVDPLTLGARLSAAGFTEVDVTVLAFGLRFEARTGQ